MDEAVKVVCASSPGSKPADDISSLVCMELCDKGEDKKKEKTKEYLPLLPALGGTDNVQIRIENYL